jgi:ADP-ribose pyrophosphatase YjhB (NUDIX family)
VSRDVKDGHPRERRPAVAAVVVADARLLLVRRGHEPHAGLWSLPGGRLQPGEESASACRRELLEETGLVGEIVEEVGRVQLGDDPGFEVVDYRCRVTGGSLRAGDDATDVGWFDSAGLHRLGVTPGLLDILQTWGVLELLR